MLTILLFSNRVIAVVNGRIVTPQAHRPSDGEVHVKLHFTNMSAQEVETDKFSNIFLYIICFLIPRVSKRTAEIARIVEKYIRESNAISTRSLSVLATVYVWSIEINIHVINDCGCIIDAALYAAFTSLIHFRKPRTDIIADKLIVVCLSLY